MELVKRMKCEKKLDLKYETSNDSDCTSSSRIDNPAKSSRIDNPAKKEERQTSKRKNKYRWFHFLKSNKPDDNLWDDTIKNHRSSMALISANHFAAFLDKRAAIFNDIHNRTTAPASERRNDVDNSRTVHANERAECTTVDSARSIPEEYWKNEILPKFSADQRDLLAESLFSHIWKTQGETMASKLLKTYDFNNLNSIAVEHFDHGCQLWAGNNAEGARSEFERSRRIREVQAAQKSLLHIQYLQDKESVNQNTESDMESNAELFFALGMVQSARNYNHASLKEFRRAMQVSALGLGMEHELTKASLYMLRSTYLAMGQTEHEIQHNVSQLTDDLHNEIEGDQLYESGEKEQALMEYANLKLLYDSDSMVQARVITKMARIFEDKEDHAKALDLWTDLLVLYEDTPSLGLHHPLARHALAKVVGARRKVQPWSEI
jgi:hypothetical protein